MKRYLIAALTIGALVVPSVAVATNGQGGAGPAASVTARLYCERNEGHLGALRTTFTAPASTGTFLEEVVTQNGEQIRHDALYLSAGRTFVARWLFSRGTTSGVVVTMHTGRGNGNEITWVLPAKTCLAPAVTP